MRWWSPRVAIRSRGRPPGAARPPAWGRRAFLAAALALAAAPAPFAPAPFAPAWAAAPTSCEAPPELLDNAAPLPATERALAEGALRVLVVGSASVLGPGSSTPAHAWPARLEASLHESRPALRLEVKVRGGRGLTAADMLPLIEGATSPPPHLVIWQVGTVEAARGLEPDWLAGRLATGLEGLKERGIDAVLMDQQFSRFLRANADINAYQDTIRIAAAGQGAAVFPRYELMRHWADTDRIDLERAPRAGRAAMVDLLGDCLGGAIAAFVLRGASLAAGPRP
ncbi:SGNH/GDSL hydrolase family protein [Roseomonas nepalensis]|uniref:SGNH/GDSL hydrolase family protein n=1 Tax=Muricoccus nepalensis TaxID=1854500 RepID=A0A502F203_9PROT|nr:SGNH/GDSL hydrolase family protein [Roseomonas nepalensis]TPG44198.1 SGNH/GDSL hydrolase family protein [Roseomonas nepalensis]